MTPRLARRILFVLGFITGAGLMGGFVAGLLLVLGSASGAGWESRSVLAARLAWVRSGAMNRAPLVDVSAVLADNRRV